MNIREVLARHRDELQAKQEAFGKLTPEEQALALKAEAQSDAKIEAILQQLRGPGFMEVKVS